jgi:hypothetical protein
VAIHQQEASFTLTCRIRPRFTETRVEAADDLFGERIHIHFKRISRLQDEIDAAVKPMLREVPANRGEAPRRNKRTSEEYFLDSDPRCSLIRLVPGTPFLLSNSLI